MAAAVDCVRMASLQCLAMDGVSVVLSLAKGAVGEWVQVWMTNSEFLEENFLVELFYLFVAISILSKILSVNICELIGINYGSEVRTIGHFLR